MTSVIEYVSGFDFADVVKDLDGDYVKLMGTTTSDRYCFGIGEDKIIYINLPTDEHDGIVRKLAPLRLRKNVVLPKRMNFLGNVTNSNGKMVRYKGTLEDCTIVNRKLDDEFEIVGKQIDMEGFFNKSYFIGFDNGLTIKNSSIEVAHMFENSKSLKHIIFKNCELSSLVGLVSNSDVEFVTFEDCSYVARDDSHLKSYERRLEASGLDDVFGWQTTVVNLKNCDVSLVNELMRLNEDSPTFLRELEINITD